MTLAAIDWGQLLELVWVSALAGFLVSLTFSALILGVAKAEEHRQRARHAIASAYAVVALLAGLVFVGGVGFAISVIVSK